jgi:hypothetical protein
MGVSGRFDRPAGRGLASDSQSQKKQQRCWRKGNLIIIRKFRRKMKKILMVFLLVLVPILSLAQSESFNIPEKSKIIIDGEHGCFVAIKYLLEINQEGNTIFLRGESYQGKFDKKISIKEYRLFWSKFIALNPMNLKEEYGEMATTADFRGKLIIEFTDKKKTYHKEIELRKGEIKDNTFKQIYKLIMGLVDEKNRLP